jgi:hypothetical protein
MKLAGQQQGIHDDFNGASAPRALNERNAFRFPPCPHFAAICVGLPVGRRIVAGNCG